MRAAGLAPAPQPGSCQIGRATGTLNVNQVQATVFTTGTLFYGPGDASLYFVPQQSRLSPVYASSVWVAGLVDGELRVAGTTYGQGGTNNDYFEFWPGPLNDDATLVNPDCSVYDKIYVVSRTDIQAYDAGGAPTPDLRDWPADLGAPVIDGDGDPDNYNLAGGDRPDIIGDQSLWYILNDVGNLHRTTQSEPIGVEVLIQAFSFARDNALGQTTFYKYTINYKGDEPLEEAYLSVFSDPDLGDAGDDFVGVDPEISLGYVYNADNVDGGANGYGTAPPAVGYDFFQGPLVDSDGDGDVDDDDERLGLTSFMYFINGDANRGDPGDAQEYYRIMQGRWSDGTPMTAFGTGYNQGGDVTAFAYPGDPVSRNFWSEEVTGSGRNVPGDRRFVLSTGPFTINPGDSQEIVFGIVYGRGNNRLSSITALRAADVFAQNAYDLDFNLPIPASAPPLCDDPNGAGPNARLPGSGTCFYASELDGQVVLNWGYAPGDDAYLGEYESQGYDFEGFNLYRYPTGSFSRDERQLVATYDKVNDITTLQNIFFDPEVGADVPVLAAQGTDSGLAYSYLAPNLTNYTDYYYGLTTYIVNDEADQERVIESSPRFLTVRPSSVSAANGGTEVMGTVSGALEAQEVSVTGGGTIQARIVDPLQVTGDDYEVRFFRPVGEDGSPRQDLIAYNIVNATTGAVLFDGQSYFDENGTSSPEIDDVISAQGLSFSVAGAIPALLAVEEEAPDGRVTSLLCSISISGGTEYPVYIAAANGGAVCSGNEIPRLDWQGGITAITPIDIEIRYTEPENGQIVFNRQWDEEDPAEAFMLGWITAESATTDGATTTLVNPQQNTAAGDVPRLPFTVWEVSPDGSETQVTASVLDDTQDLFYGPSNGQLAGTGGFGPAAYERIYVRRHPYNEAAILADPVAEYEAYFGSPSTLGRFLEIPYRARTADGLAVPAPINVVTPGFTVRFRTSKPNLAGDVYRFSTAEFAVQADQGFDEEDVERIGIVPNPYYGFSEYESGNTERVARFTNLPERATMRIFTVSGTLIRTLTKDSNERSFDWNLQTENGLPVASGLYLIHIELPDSGLERVIKFGVVNRRTQIEIL